MAITNAISSIIIIGRVAAGGFDELDRHDPCRALDPDGVGEHLRRFLVTRRMLAMFQKS